MWRVIKGMHTYVFVFLGEFGYELLNWQGVVRKFSEQAGDNNTIVCCSRKGLETFYECADLYIDIAEVELFKKSVANGYSAVSPEINHVKHNEEVMMGQMDSGIRSVSNFYFVFKLHRQIKKYVSAILKERGLNKRVKFIFSDFFHVISGVKFGRTFGKSGDIYAGLDLDNNSFIKILFNKKDSLRVREKAEFNIDEPYVLCQLGHRDIVQRSKEKIETNKIIQDISRFVKVVVLEFSTGRNFDSESSYDDAGDNIYIYHCDNFHEQSVLVGKSKCCVFFTEGDFRSHNYVPPFMGKDVYSIASRSVYALPTTPIDFWNENVFKFGGHIIPVISEDLSDGRNYKKFIDMVVSR